MLHLRGLRSLKLLGVSTFKRPEWNDPERVDVLVGPEVVRLDVMPVTSFPYAWLLNHSLNESLKIGIIDDSSQIALEMYNIYQIKPRQCGEEANVCFSQLSNAFSDQPLSSLKKNF